LSLLATSVYLCIPSLASQALSTILSTIGPRTVVKYLNFALGKYIGPLDLEVGEPEAAVGLEYVAHIIDDEGSTVSTSSTVLQKEKDDVLSSFQHVNPTETLTSSTGTSLHTPSEDDSDESAAEPSSHYGTISDKIGEACACWLARWGTDLLAYETRRDEGGNVRNDPSSPLISHGRVRAAPSTILIISAGSSKTDQAIPCIWSCGGLSAKWVAAIVSADTFFVKGERERYTFARSVVELRRKDGIIEAEEEVWASMFEHGIYYSNMVID